MSRFEAHAGFFKLYVKGIFYAYVLVPFGKKIIFELVTHARTCDFMVEPYGTACNSITVQPVFSLGPPCIQ